MALSAKQKRIKERLEQIKNVSSGLQVDLANSKKTSEQMKQAVGSGFGLAEEAAGLGLELLEEAK